MRLRFALALLSFSVLLPEAARAFELTTPWGARPDAWAVCEPQNADHYVWTRGGAVIPGPTSAWYWIESHDAGHELRCGVDGNLSAPRQIASSVSPAPTPSPTPAPTPVPPGGDGPFARLDTPWGARAGAWAICEASPKAEITSYSWARDGVTISRPTSDWYFIEPIDDGASLTCTAYLAGGFVTSAPVLVGVVAPVPEPTPEPTPVPMTAKLDFLDFSPHLAGDVPYSILPDEIVRERVDLVAPYTNGIRTFACYNGDEAIRYAKSLGLTTIAGAWIDLREDEAEAELRCLISLAREGVVDLAVVGSEVVTWHGLTAAQIAEYVERFRTAVPDVPVTTAALDEVVVDPANRTIVDAVDLLFVNFYPFWDGVAIDRATDTLKQQFADVEAVSGGKEVWISETGWPDSQWFPNGLAVANPENQERYLEEVLAWTNDEQIVLAWFAAFDEPWKEGQEWAGVGGHWGLFDENGQLKPHAARVITSE